MSRLDNVRTLNDKVALQIIEKKERVSAGGIHLPESANDQSPAWEAVVLSVGPGLVLPNGRRVEPSVKKGDRVILGKYTGKEIRVDGEKIVVVKEEDILGVIEES